MHADRHVVQQAAARGGGGGGSAILRSDWSAQRCRRIAKEQSKLLAAGLKVGCWAPLCVLRVGCCV